MSPRLPASGRTILLLLFSDSPLFRGAGQALSSPPLSSAQGASICTSLRKVPTMQEGVLS